MLQLDWYLKVLAVVLCILFANTIAQAQCTAFVQPLEERIQAASIIIEGRVTAAESAWNEEHDFINTTYVIEVYSVLAGQSGPVLKVQLPGGTVGMRRIVVKPTIRLENGMEGIFMIKLATSNDGVHVFAHQVYGFAKFSEDRQAVLDADEAWVSRLSRERFYAIVRSLKGEQRRVLKEIEISHAPESRTTAPENITVSPNTGISAGTQSSITISGNGFGNTTGSVQFRFANNPNSSLIPAASNDIQSWSDNTIVVWVPSDAATGPVRVVDNDGGIGESAQNIDIESNITTINNGVQYAVHLIETSGDSHTGYRFIYSESSANNGVNFVTEAGGQAVSSFESALAGWQGNGFGAYTGEVCGTTMVNAVSGDNINIVMFANDNTPLNAGVLGQATSYYGGCGSGGWEVEEIDIVFANPNSTNWAYSGTPSIAQVDFESVALHEIGHTHQLGHINSTGDVMHRNIADGTTSRNLSSNELDASDYVNDISSNYTPPFCSSNTTYQLYDNNNECMALPVSWLAASAIPHKTGAVIQWATADEVNNASFTVEYANDGRQYQAIATVQAKGNGNTRQDYAYQHPYLPKGKHFYRIRQTDFDGTYSYSDILTVDITSGAEELIVKQNGKELWLNSSLSEFSELKIFNVYGQLVHQQQFASGPLQTTIHLGEYPTGVLLYSLQTNDGVIISSGKLLHH